MPGGAGGRADRPHRLPEGGQPVLRCGVRRVPGEPDVGARAGRPALDVGVVGGDADPDILAERPPEGVVARHDEEGGRLMGTGDDRLAGVRQLGRLGGAAVKGRETGRDAVTEAHAGVGQGGPGAGALEQPR